MNGSIDDRFRGCLLGLAVGDAIGTAVEFKARGSFRLVTDMVGGEPFHLNPGQWTDDTSLALCLAESLIKKQGIDDILIKALDGNPKNDILFGLDNIKLMEGMTGTDGGLTAVWKAGGK